MDILIADDHAVIRSGVKQVLCEKLDEVVFHEVNSGKAVIEAVKSQALSFVILGVIFPDKNGLEVLWEIKHLRPRLPVIILSFYPDSQYERHVLRGGGWPISVQGLVWKNWSGGVQRTVEEEKNRSQTLAEQIRCAVDGAHNKCPWHPVSDLENQVLSLMAQGKAPTEIGIQLGFSGKTINSYQAQ